jgi:peptidoglycan/LPS O-acetylase OafA/YrhL
MPHLGGLDGLRALAVVAVVLYHLDLAWIPGGFLGVDVFFVLSGFLITALVLEEVERTGRLDVRRFYLRRARRLLPALGLVLLAVSATAVLGVREEIPELRTDVPAALLYVSNWWYVASDASYFEFTGRPPLLQHLWSLAVEEQFYLLWPAVVVAAMAVGRRRVRRVAVVGALLSTAAMATLAAMGDMPVPNDASRVYYGTDTHAMGLLVGAALATLWAPWRRWSGERSWLSRRAGPHRGWVGVVDLVGVACLVGVVLAFLRVGQFSPGLYRGGFLALAVLTAGLVATLAHPAGLLGRAMAVQPMRYLGERSYGSYLWHWPVFMLSRPGFELDQVGWPADVARVALTLLLAELSYRLVERPIRHGAIARAVRRSRERTPQGRTAALRLIGAGAATALAVGLVGFGLYRAAAAVPLGPADGSVNAAIAGEGGGSGADGPASDAGASTSAADLGTLGAEQRPVPSPTSAPPPVSDPAPAPSVSAFGDSVLLGAADDLGAAGVTVDAAEERHYPQVFDAIRAARDAGTLGGSVVIHTGNNGPIAEPDLRALLDDLGDRRVYLVTVALPRAWEGYNNDLFGRVAAAYPDVSVLDWRGVAAANPGWLYDDGLHLVAPEGRRGYAQWLLAQVAT